MLIWHSFRTNDFWWFFSYIVTSQPLPFDLTFKLFLIMTILVLEPCDYCHFDSQNLQKLTFYEKKIALVMEKNFWKGKCIKRPISTFVCTFSAFFGFWVFFLWSPLGNYEKKSSVSSDLNVSFKRPWKKKHLLGVSLKTVENWRNGSQMC